MLVQCIANSVRLAAETEDCMYAKKTSFVWTSVMAMLLAVVMSGRMAAQTEKVLHNFGAPGDAFNPVAGLTWDSSGNLYGPASDGTGTNCGSNGCGAVFELQPNADGTWSESLLYTLDGVHGAHPTSQLIFDGQGNLYGASLCNQDYCYYAGEVFELSPNGNGTWTPSILHTFPTFPFDGGSPLSLVLDGSGNLYGEADTGGLNNTGLIFELNRARGWRESLLYVFGPFEHGDGSGPGGSFVRDANGNLYGTTYVGGSGTQGIVFELIPPAGGVVWQENVLYTFTGNENTRPNGVSFGPDGSLYGTTQGGGAFGHGSVFNLKQNPDGSWSETDLYSFTGGTDGEAPGGGVTFDGSGNLYGTTVLGGNECGGLGCGVVYELSPSQGGGWSQSVLYRFKGEQDGENPLGNLVLDQAGNLYGVTDIGGLYGNQGGVVFEVVR